MLKKELCESLYESKGLWMMAAVSVILSAVGKVFLIIDPMANCFNLMPPILTDGLGIAAVLKFIWPQLIFCALMVWASKRVSLKGEK